MYRVGIDVGGTFTKAVAVDSGSLKLVGKASVPTTYSPPGGVSKGIIASLERLFETAQISPAQIELLAFSTTHAVNALLEGDVTPVGIITMGSSTEKSDAVKRTRLGNLEFNQGRKLMTFYKFIEVTDGLDEDLVKETIIDMINSGARAVVASEAFGVEDPENENTVKRIARGLGIPCVTGHEVSGAYGLEIRTITAAINAGILPRMMEVAESLEEGVRELGIKAPIMVMKCDGGLSTLEILKTKPIFTILSGPAASVVGTHLYTNILDGIVIEVGGTTTNMSVVKNGKVEMRYIDVLGYPTTIRSMDVRILPVGGGNLVRVKGGKIAEVGPRSASIAGLPYCAFESPGRLEDAGVINIAPKEGDPEDHVALEAPSGKYALTLTCASNFLGIPPPGDYARGNREAAGTAMGVVSESLNAGGEEVAEEILKKASKKMEDVIKSLMREYRLDRGRTVLVGAGGGASVIIPYTAERLGLPFKIPEHAEVISSAGTAAAMVREELERNLTEYDEEAVPALVEEAREMVIERGAMPETVSVSTEYVPGRRCIRVVAVGSTINSRFSGGSLSGEHGKELVGAMLGVSADKVELASKTRYYFVFRCPMEEGMLFLKRRRDKIVVLDRFGRTHLLLEDGVVIEGRGSSIIGGVRLYLSSKKGPVDVSPRVYVVSDSRVVDFSVFTKAPRIISVLSDLVKKIGESRVVVLVGR